MRRQFDRADLELISELSRTASLGLAAKALGVHHATAFRRLGDIERRVGSPVFERVGGRYVAAVSAHALIASASRLAIQFREVDSHARDISADSAQPLRVTTSDGLAAAVCPALLRDFNAAFPDIVVDLMVENRLMSISEREVDVALRPAREVSGDMVCRRVAAMGYTLYASAGYVREHGWLGKKHLDFGGHRVCAYAEPLAYFTTAKWLAENAKAARVVAYCNSLTAMQSMARTGMCIAALPCVLGDADPGLKALLPPIEAMETSLWVCTHKALRKTRRVRAFVDFFYNAIEAQKERLSGRAGR